MDLGAAAPFLVTAALLAYAVHVAGRGWRASSETRAAEAMVRLERLRLRRDELAAEERERDRRTRETRRRVAGFLG